MTSTLRSPVTGEQLVRESETLLRDADGGLWPVVDGIAYLRTGREDLVREATQALLAGRREAALALLLGDQDDWWNGETPTAQALRTLVRDRGRLSLREAMDHLAYGRVGHYFAHRWSDPTFLAGLALLQAHWRPARTALELACGIGHYGRELARRGVAYTGADVVFGKLWLARHFVLPPEARLVCMDAASPWPVAGERFDLVFCHDAFYFLEPKEGILDALRSVRATGGRLCLGHIHNSGADNLSAGRAVSAEDLRRLFPDAATFDDLELTRAAAGDRAPRPAAPDAIRTVNAFSVEDGPPPQAHLSSDGLTVPPDGAPLRLNPLYAPDGDGWAVEWPSERYRAEYAADATYPERLTGEERRRIEAGERDAGHVRRRVLVDLPERW